MTKFGELILNCDWGQRNNPTFYKAVTFKPAQTLGECFLRYAFDLTPYGVEAQRARFKDSQHHHRPLIGDLVEQLTARAFGGKALGADHERYLSIYLGETKCFLDV